MERIKNKGCNNSVTKGKDHILKGHASPGTPSPRSSHNTPHGWQNTASPRFHKNGHGSSPARSSFSLSPHMLPSDQLQKPSGLSAGHTRTSALPDRRTATKARNKSFRHWLPRSHDRYRTPDQNRACFISSLLISFSGSDISRSVIAVIGYSDPVNRTQHDRLP